MLTKVDPKTLTFNPFHAIGSQWMLITAGTAERCNTMTASWGGVGIMWGKPVATAYIRPQRYTKTFWMNRTAFYPVLPAGPVPQGTELLRQRQRPGRTRSPAAALRFRPPAAAPPILPRRSWCWCAASSTASGWTRRASWTGSRTGGGTPRRTITTCISVEIVEAWQQA